MDLRAVLEDFAAVFNHGDFYEAHEVAEDAWILLKYPPGHALKGYVQLATAYEQMRRGKPAGALRLFRRSSRYLKDERACNHRELLLWGLRAARRLRAHPVPDAERRTQDLAKRPPLEILPPAETT